MALASISDLISMLPELATVDSGTIQLYLDDAQNMVELHGFGVNNSNFSQLQRYMTAHIMTLNGFVKGDIKSKAVADVNVSYGGTSVTPTAFETKWLKLYNDLKTSIKGLACRIL